MVLYYYFLKTVLFGTLLRALVKYEPMQRHTLALSVLYTAGVAFLSYVFLLSPQPVVDWTFWQYWLGLTFLATVVYFKLLARFDEGPLFWTLLILGVLLIFNEPNLLPLWRRAIGR